MAASYLSIVIRLHLACLYCVTICECDFPSAADQRPWNRHHRISARLSADTGCSAEGLKSQNLNKLLINDPVFPNTFSICCQHLSIVALILFFSRKRNITPALWNLRNWSEIMRLQKNSKEQNRSWREPVRPFLLYFEFVIYYLLFIFDISSDNDDDNVFSWRQWWSWWRLKWRDKAKQITYFNEIHN